MIFNPGQLVDQEARENLLMGQCGLIALGLMELLTLLMLPFEQALSLILTINVGLLTCTVIGLFIVGSIFCLSIAGQWLNRRYDALPVSIRQPVESVVAIAIIALVTLAICWNIAAFLHDPALYFQEMQEGINNLFDHSAWCSGLCF